MLNSWKTYNLFDFIDINPRMQFSSKEEYSFVEMKDLDANNKIVLPSNFKKLKGGAKFQNGDTLFARITPCLENGKICQVKGLKNNMGFGSTEFLVFRGKKNISDSDFIYYLSREPYVRQFAESNMIGTSGRQRVAKEAFKNLKLELPPLPEQKAIAQILSAIDDKIENNLAINKTLEDMAMALYKHWFVDFGPFQDGEFVDSELGLIPKGWEVKRLDEVAYKNSKTFNFKNKKEVVFVNTGDVQNGSFLHKNYSEIEGLPGQAKKAIEFNDILYSEIRPGNRRYAYVDFDSSDYVVSTKFMIIRNNEKINNRLLYRVLTIQETVDEFQMIAESRSGTFPQITFDAIGHFKIVLPQIELQNKFQSIVEPLEQQQANNLNENQTLTQLRDTLLPKLISGEVRLKAFQEEVEQLI